MKDFTILITGASEGLGKSLALDCARRKMNLVLISLPESGLDSLANYIRLNFGVKVFCISLDLTIERAAEMTFDKINGAGIKVQALINNAGLGNWSWFEDKSPAFYKMQIDLNITSAVLLTQQFLKHRDKHSAAYMLNVGSLGGHFIVPRKQVYGATKSFISYFTKCLQLELSHTNVSVSLLSPGGINTKAELLVMNSNLKGFARATILEAEFVAKQALDGMLSGKKEIVPGLANRFLLILDSILPAFMKDIIIKRNLRHVLAV